MENPARRPAAREVLERLVNMHQEWSEETERDNRGAQNLLAHMLPPKVASLLKRGLRVRPPRRRVRVAPWPGYGKRPRYGKGRWSVGIHFFCAPTPAVASERAPPRGETVVPG